MPATNAVSERSFSALPEGQDILAIYNELKQTRLNHLIILHAHKEKTDSLNLHDIGKELLRCSEHRFSVSDMFRTNKLFSHLNWTRI